MTPQTMSMITRVFPPRQRGAALGLWGATAGVATIAGPLLGGVFVETLGWEWIFYVNIPVGVVALWLSVTRLPALRSSQTARLDGLGVVLSVAGLGLLIFGIQEGETFDWGHIWGPFSVWGVVGAGAALLVGFALWQRRLGSSALLPLRLFRSRNFSLANVDGMAVSFAMIGIFFPLTIFLQSILGLTPIQAALINLPSSLVSGVVAPFAGRLSDRVPAKWVVAFGFAAIAGAVVWLDLIIAPDVSAWVFVWPMVLFGLGTGCVFSPLSNLATSGLDHRTAGAGAGAFNTFRQVGESSGPPRSSRRSRRGCRSSSPPPRGRWRGRCPSSSAARLSTVSRPSAATRPRPAWGASSSRPGCRTTSRRRSGRRPRPRSTRDSRTPRGRRCSSPRRSSWSGSCAPSRCRRSSTRRRLLTPR
ncbi:hypothetical protein GCM10025865_02740 [Paraoerskovia sediminicola]|uniref:Major facilitator superfamily (MFS) profile domain-containing protein n=1 Tax=Paraoerskovia sediminicola TaxID=1138587 RepID=A0ABM8FZA4_9CELL|nr:MFS transporter [Paraoerskovia sediminicola]BDZ40975.1 hypothetical protein GCM10025865_02740 [Paraoerskovia sediminicola]